MSAALAVQRNMWLAKPDYVDTVGSANHPGAYCEAVISLVMSNQRAE